MKYTRGDIQVEGSADELAGYFNIAGTPHEDKTLNQSINGWVVAVVGALAGIMMLVSCISFEIPEVNHFVNTFTILLMACFCILLQCKFSNTKTTIVVVGILVVFFALLKGVTSFSELSTKVVDTALTVKESE